jgi:glycosyltransferase involved in cell wall biosynthesis
VVVAGDHDRHERFLPEAIESALGQTHPRVEVVVVDDGSTDRSAEVAARFPGTRVVRQANQGLSAARNTGIASSTGELLMFLDADDRLLSDAVERSLEALEERPECALVFGRFHVMDARGARLLTSELPALARGAYLELLRTNAIVMHGTCLIRRRTFEEVGLYDTSLRASEDYDLYLRVARVLPIAGHEAVVAEVRKHGENMTRDYPRMLRYTLAALAKQLPHVGRDPARRAAYREGVAFWKSWYGRKLAFEMTLARFEGRTSVLRRGLAPLLWYHPRGFLEALRARRSNALPFVVSNEHPAPAEAPPGAAGALVLRRLGIAWTTPGAGFNVQPNGRSALWLSCENATPRTVIVFGGVALDTTFQSPAALTAFVPPELYAEPGLRSVYLVG